MTLALIRGLLLGFVAAIPLGPVNAAVIDTAFRKCFFRALAIGIGGALADLAYSQIALAGLAPLLQHRPELSTLLLGIGGVVLVVFGVVTVRQPPVDPAPSGRRPVLARAFLAAVATGILITVANPAALVSWVLIAGTVLADLGRWAGLVAGVGIFAGTTLWFLLIAALAHKGRVRLGTRAVWITRTVGGLLVAYGAFLVGKASLVVWAARH